MITTIYIIDIEIVPTTKEEIAQNLLDLARTAANLGYIRCPDCGDLDCEVTQTMQLLRKNPDATVEDVIAEVLES